MNNTSIEWTTFSANPVKYRQYGKTVWACVKTSPGCSKCYSESSALRFNRGKLFNAKNMEEVEPYLDKSEVRKMRTAKTVGGIGVPSSRCFVGDMTDIFGSWVSDDLLNRLFSDVLELRTDVIWQLLTKRAKRMSGYLSRRWGDGRIPSRNIHVGVSVEDQQRADERIPHLLRCPAAVRFLSCEPLIGPVDLSQWLRGQNCTEDRSPRATGIGWIICGGESGHGARPMHPDWVRSIRDQCRAAGVPFFFKQGSQANWTKYKDFKSFPPDLQIREFP